ncbi:ABC transporter ATP-binding protein [Tsukamurella soli]|uniref:ABC transporter ATP-binding protein n=1 Tax=Tsukamurella soli TaxID=644556 RepID=UPI00361A7E7F
MLPQQHTIGFAFTCREVVEMGRFPWRGTPQAAEDDGAVAAAIDECAVGHLAERPFGSLSGGERARVALARVLAQRTPVLLLDEPTAALDPHHQESVMQVVRRRAAEGDAALVVVHDLSLAAAYSDRVAVLVDGRIDAVGPPVEVLTEERLERVYGLPMATVTVAGQRLIVPRRSPDPAERRFTDRQVGLA